MAVDRHAKEVAKKKDRLARLAAIREVVFGGQDGLISTATLVFGIAATTSQPELVLLAGSISALAGALSMAVGAYLASRAQRQVYVSELARERREISQSPAEKTAELESVLINRGLSRREALDIARRVKLHPKLLRDLLGALELGLTPQSLCSPLRDATVTGVAFIVGSIIPLLPFTLANIRHALAASVLLVLGSLFIMGTLKARLSGRAVIRSGLEVLLLGGGAGLIGYVMGHIVRLVFGISI